MPSKTLLPLEAILASIFVNFCTSGTPKNRALAVARCHFLQKWPVAPGAPKSSPKGSQNRGQKPPWRLQDGFKTRPKKGFDFGYHFEARFVDFGGTRGGRSVKMASKIASKTALASKLGLSTPESPPGAHFDASILEPPGADFRGLGRCIGSLAGSTFAAKRLANKWWSAVLAEP